jgi:alkylated DNA repair protein (DNA oxidative demethylase)
VTEQSLPSGFLYFPEIISAEDERRLMVVIGGLDFEAVVMRGYTAKRRTIHYGVRYSYDTRRPAAGPPMPEFLQPLRQTLALAADVDASAFTEALVTEYAPGSTIGWHRDAPAFGPTVLGLSLGSACRMRFRLIADHDQRASIVMQPRSAYALTAESRRDWQHSIPAVDALRYSVTFRSLRRPQRS